MAGLQEEWKVVGHDLLKHGEQGAEKLAWQQQMVKEQCELKVTESKVEVL
jgi:hypothetical protein